MYNYIKEVSEMCHNIIKNYSVNFKYAVDGTLGNGYDSIFLSKYFEKVYSFEIQECAVSKFHLKNIKNVEVFLDSHENIEKYIDVPLDAVMYNLGYLPGGDKSVTTKESSTILSLKSSIKLLNTNGLITICVYKGHEEGKSEYISLINYLSHLDKKKFRVVKESFLNMNENAPEIIVIEKSSK